MAFYINLNVLPILALGFLDLFLILTAHWFQKKKLVAWGAVVMFFLYFVALALKG